MVELKFTCLRVLMDIVFIVLMFFGFMCGIHYGTRLIGLYFWFIKFLLGIVGVGGVIFIMNFIKTPTLFFIKNASIYADSITMVHNKVIQIITMEDHNMVITRTVIRSHFGGTADMHQIMLLQKKIDLRLLPEFSHFLIVQMKEGLQKSIHQ